jgi:tetratricopeptide (TPR) repeat protein
MKNVVLLTLAVFFSATSFAQDAAEKISQANDAMKAEEYSKAFSLYDEAMKNIGDVEVEPTINYNIAVAGYRADNMDGALGYFDKAIEAGVNLQRSYEYKARIYNKKEDYTKAVANYEQAIAEADDGDTTSMIFNAAIAAYRGNMLDKAVELFEKSVENGYRGETALYYKAVALKKQNKDAAYLATLEEGAQKYPDDEKISSALANFYVSEGNELYRKGVDILNAANQKVQDGSLKTSDDAYAAEVEKAQVEFKAALNVLQKAKELDPSNENAKKLIDACSAVL